MTDNEIAALAALLRLDQRAQHRVMLMAQAVHRCEENLPPAEVPYNGYPRSQDEIERIKAIPIDDLELSTRAFTCLRKAQIATIGDLMTWDRERLLRLRQFGRRSLREVIDVLGHIGVELAA